MKTRWIVSLVLVFSLLAGFLSVGRQTAHAQDAASDKAVPKAEAESDATYGPHTCPMIPIEVYGSAALYEAQYYPDDTCTFPTLTYAYGNLTYPRTCPDCDPNKYDAPQPFYGLAMAVPADYEHRMPAGRPSDYSRKALTPDRIDYLYLKKQRVYVKVFARDVNRADMESGAPANPANFKDTIYFAFECSDPASIGVNVAEIDEIPDSKQRAVPDPGGAPTTVYDVTYDNAGGQTHILTFLCGDPEPPIDGKARAVADQ